MRLECRDSFRSLEGLEVVEGLECLDRLERRSWAFDCFFRFLTF